MGKTKVENSISYIVYRVRSWVKTNRLEAMLLSSILLIGAFLRLYRIDEYMTFLGDEGRDAIIVRRFLVDFDLFLIGPGTSIGDMYLGPLYYYMMAPFLLLADFSPVGPAVMIALLGVLTIGFVWWVVREWFYANKGVSWGGLVAAALYAVSPVVVIYSRSSWNPNIMPFFALLSIYSTWRAWQKFEFKWLVVLGISLAFVLQSHYLGLLLIPTLAIFWLLAFYKVYRLPSTPLRQGRTTLLSFERSERFAGQADHQSQRSAFVKHSLVGLASFLILMSPLLLFDIRHNWINYTAMQKFFTERQTTVSARPWTAIPEIPEIANQAITRLIAGGNESVGIWLTVGMMVGVMWLIFLRWKKFFSKQQAAYYLLLTWLAVAFIGLGLYKQHIYDHYYGFFFPAPFLLLGGLVHGIVDTFKKSFLLMRLIAYCLLLIAFFLLLYFNLADNSLKYPPNRQLQRTTEVAESIVAKSGGKRFNFAVIAERNYEGAYQYFLEHWDSGIVIIDPQRLDVTLADQLFVVCELPEYECDPVHNPKTEVAAFGWSRIEDQWQVAGVTLYKLVHAE